MKTQIEKYINVLGNPDLLEQDNRAGIFAVWGNREKGGFAVSRGAADTEYEIDLVPSPKSKAKIEKHYFTHNQLNSWFNQNVDKIKSVLSGN